MSKKIISDLPPVSHTSVEAQYSAEEVLDRLATAVNYLREQPVFTEQRLELELLYSLAKAFYEDRNNSGA